MDKRKRYYVLRVMFILFIFFIIFVVFYEKENKEIAVNKYYLSYFVKEKFNDIIDDTKVISLVENETDRNIILSVFELSDEDNYVDFNSNYVYVAIRYNSCGEEIYLNKIKKNDDRYEFIFKDKLSCGVCANEIMLFEVPVDKDFTDMNKVDITIKYDDSNQVNCEGDIVEKKPVLYLYPEEDLMVNVEFEHEENLLSTYPKYKNSWNVLAKKDGTLIDNNGREYYALYWDEKLKHEEKFETGFFVKSEDSIEFLENKLLEIGLTDREANEFIMYWLPVMEQGGDNLVHFHFTDDREKQNKIYIEPAVDSLFRFSIEIKKTDKEVKIKEQKIEKFERYGFSALEWGGTIIK